MRLAQHDSFSARIIAVTYERKLAADTTQRLFLLVEKIYISYIFTRTVTMMENREQKCLLDNAANEKCRVDPKWCKMHNASWQTITGDGHFTYLSQI